MACQWNNYEIKRYHHTSIRILFLFLCVRWCSSHTLSQRDGSEFWMHYSFSSRWPSIQGPQHWFAISSSWSFFVYIVLRLSPAPCTKVRMKRENKKILWQRFFSLGLKGQRIVCPSWLFALSWLKDCCRVGSVFVCLAWSVCRLSWVLACSAQLSYESLYFYCIVYLLHVWAVLHCGAS